MPVTTIPTEESKQQPALSDSKVAVPQIRSNDVNPFSLRRSRTKARPRLGIAHDCEERHQNRPSGRGREADRSSVGRSFPRTSVEPLPDGDGRRVAAVKA